MDKEKVVVRRAAMDYLARREHSRYELHHKLQTRFTDSAFISQVLDKLEDDGLQSDARFAENYMRWRANKGFGPLHIAQDLKQKGVDEAIIQFAFKENNIDWQQLIKQQYIKKYGESLPLDVKAKARCQRFLISRGFSFSQISQLWRQLARENPSADA